MSTHNRITAFIGLLCAAGLLVCSAVPLSAASGTSLSARLSPAWLVADIDPTNQGSAPNHLTVLNGKLFLTACTGPIEGYYVIASPSAEPLLLAASRPIINSYNNLPDPHFTWFDGQLFFVLDTIESGPELWQSDGTPTGTHIFKDLTPGAQGSWPDRLTVAGNWLYFTIGPNLQLMRTDGSPDLVQPITDLLGPSADIILAAFGSDLLFTTGQSSNGPVSLWKTSGTPETIQILQDPSGPVFINPNHMTPGKGPGDEDWLYFAASDQLHGQELWRTDGTPSGTRLVKDFTPGENGYFTGDMIYANGALYLAAGDASHLDALWRTDGSEAGTQLVSYIPPDGSMFSPGLEEFTVFNGKIYFTAVGPAGDQIWRTDGTASGTAPVAELPLSLYSKGPTSLTVAGNHLFFAAHTNNFKRIYQAELWSIDAQEQPAKLKDFLDCVGGTAYPANELQNLTNFSGQLYFAGCDYLRSDELWTSDGTQGGTRLVFDFNIHGNRSFANSLAKLNGRYFFSSTDADHTPARHHEIMYSVSTAPGSLQPLLSRTGSLINEISGPVRVGDALFFTGVAFDGSEAGLFRSDGTPEGTESILPYGMLSGAPVIYHPFQDTILMFDNFTIRDPEHHLPNQEVVNIWKTNGQPGGTELVASLPDESRFTYRVYAFHGAVYFMVNHNSQAELWRTDGTAEGTQMAASLTGQFESVRSLDPTSQLLFFYLDNGWRIDLWQSDGTQEGTQLVMTVDPATPSYSTPGVRSAAMLGDTLFFIAVSPEGEFRLMKTQGADSGVEEVYNFGLLTVLTEPEAFTPLDQAIYFCSGVGQADRRLWRTDGTPDGTYPLFSANTPSQGCANLIQRGGRLFYSASTPETGAELWTSLGSPEDTRLLADINPGPEGSDPYVMDSENGILLVQAGTTETGVELWAVRLDTSWFYLPSISR
jgi:ELWxxDGT repeat protein